MEAILFALLSYVCWGSGDVIFTIASRRLGVYTVTFWSSIVSIIFFALYSPFALNDLKNLTPDILFINILVGIVFVVGFLAFTEALIVDNASLVGTIVGSFGAVIVILSIIFFHEQVSPSQALAILTIFIGITLSTLHFDDLRKKKLKFSKGVMLAFVTMIMFGIYGTFIKIPVSQIGWFWPNFIMFLVFPPIIFLFARFRHVSIKKPTSQNALFPLVVAALIIRIGELSYNIAVSKGLIAIVAPIATSYPTLFALLAYFVFKDRITRQQIAGIIVTLCGIVLLGIFSS